MITEMHRQMVDDHGRRLAYGEVVTAIVWTENTAYFALGDGRLCAEGARETTGHIPVHKGAILCATRHPDGRSVLTGGDDGRIFQIRDSQSKPDILHSGSRWIENIAASSQSGFIVASAGREAIVWTAKIMQEAYRIDVPSTVTGLALTNDGVCLAISHYGGVSVHVLGTLTTEPEIFFWAGSHIGCAISGDGSFVVSAVQETGLHGWQRATGQNMAMSGYSAKTKSLSWGPCCQWLASSGDRSAIIWPFDGEDGPMGRGPYLLGVGHDLVTCVASHPSEEIVAIGYNDGTVILASIQTNECYPVQDASGAPVSAIAWNDNGTGLAWGTENGRAGFLHLAKIE